MAFSEINIGAQQVCNRPKVLRDRFVQFQEVCSFVETNHEIK